MLPMHLKTSHDWLSSEPESTQHNTMASSFYPSSMSDPRISAHDFDYNVLDGIEAVIKTTNQRESCMWTYLRNNPPSDSTGYMFSNNPEFGAIMNNMQVGHSGGSYAWTMRNLQYIASNGMDAYITACSPKPKHQSATASVTASASVASADI